ncbi:GGDEF domain-containing protein [Trichloromonas sp.]|uniref:GGDEF domain-containing protein n=1 Tax=Trichloromonas sp. TaxID=3069249 RepID=UPI002A485078|nr:diguanylate cyclase [Trichloromonas sp.]
MEKSALAILRRLDETLAGALRRGFPRQGLCASFVDAKPEDPELAGIVERLSQFLAMLDESQGYATRLADGDLSASAARNNILAMPLKALQADLKHLIWQTEQVATGDLNQQVHFLGDFSAAFNSMILALREKRRLEEQLHEVNQALEKQAATDVLTGLFNRLKLGCLLDTEIVRAQRYATPLSVILLDIDHFKQINDTRGHQVGDDVLRELAQRLLSSLRSCDAVARWGGEEFLVMLPNSPLAAGRECAEKLRVAIADCPFTPMPQVTASFGVAELQKGEPRETLIGRADQALYRAKNNGRNCVECA